MSQKTKVTNRKFYNKWLYKTTLIIQGAGIFRLLPLEEIKKFCLSNTGAYYQPYSMHYKAWFNRDSIHDLTEFLLSKDSNTWTKRIESKCVDFYTNDRDFYLELSSKFQSIVVHQYEPAVNTIDSLENEEVILVKKFPHKKYRHKVFLLPHKLAKDPESKTKYLEWILGQGDKITCTPAIQHWFMATDWNWDRRYVLVEDDKTLLLLKLRNPEVMGRVYNYVLVDK
jgi:hypothetical protein